MIKRVIIIEVETDGNNGYWMDVKGQCKETEAAMALTGLLKSFEKKWGKDTMMHMGTWALEQCLSGKIIDTDILSKNLSKVNENSEINPTKNDY